MKKTFVCYNGCPFILDASCVEYTGEVLDNLINASPEDRLDTILQTIDNITFTQTFFVANSNNSIYAVGGGILGHSPEYNVRLNPSDSNLIVLTNDGLVVLVNEGGDGKVKVDAADTKDYLESQFDVADDGVVIMTVTPVKEAGKIKFQPSIDAESLLQEIKTTHLTQFCEIIHDCIPHDLDLFTTTTTSTSSTTTTSTTTTSSTTTTTTECLCQITIDNSASLDISITNVGVGVYTTPIDISPNTWPILPGQVVTGTTTEFGVWDITMIIDVPGAGTYSASIDGLFPQCYNFSNDGIVTFTDMDISCGLTYTITTLDSNCP